MTRNGQLAAPVLFHHLTSVCMRGRQKRGSPNKGNWKESTDQELRENSRDQKTWSQQLLSSALTRI